MTHTFYRVVLEDGRRCDCQTLREAITQADAHYLAKIWWMERPVSGYEQERVCR